MYILIIAVMLLFSSPVFAGPVFYGKASWYGVGDGCSHTTASGHPFSAKNPHIVAHKTLRFGTKLLLTNVANGRKLQATVLDRGPFVRGRVLDVTKAGRDILKFDGVGNLKIEVLN
jgi:rare lipoprotein A